MKARAAAAAAANPQAERRRLCEWQRANPEKVKARNAAWKAANLDKVAAQAGRRRSGRLNASPAWASKEAIGEIYKQAQDSKLSVDHIYPLQGKKVCGLHVPANLRVLCQKVNSAKRDKLPGFLAHELWDPQGEDVFYE